VDASTVLIGFGTLLRCSIQPAGFVSARALQLRELIPAGPARLILFQSGGNVSITSDIALQCFHHVLWSRAPQVTDVTGETA
jgi:hypothetical protein